MTNNTKIEARGDRLFRGEEVIAEFIGSDADDMADWTATVLRAAEVTSLDGLAIAAEREACAKIADDGLASFEIAAAIRERGGQ